MYWVCKFTSQSLAVSPPAPVAASCIKSFTVTVDEKVVLATCSGLYVWKGVWEKFQDGSWIYVRAFDEMFVYVIKDTDNNIYQYPISFG